MRCGGCGGRGWYVGDCHPLEACGLCGGTGNGPNQRLEAARTVLDLAAGAARADVVVLVRLHKGLSWTVGIDHHVRSDLDLLSGELQPVVRGLLAPVLRPARAGGA